MHDDDNFFFVSSEKLLDLKKSTACYVLQSIFFLKAPPSLSKTLTDMVKTKSNHNLNIKQTYSLINPFFHDFYSIKPPPEPFLLLKKCKSVWGKLKKHPLIKKKTLFVNDFLR